ALMPDARIVFAHFSLSALTLFAASSGVLGNGSKPNEIRRSFMSGNATISLVSRLSSAIISFGVLAGTNNPIQTSHSTSGKPASTMVGTSGRTDRRILLATAKARNVPSLTCGTTEAGEPKAIGV